MKSACAKPEVQSRRFAGRLKAAAALLASRGGAPPKNAEIIRRALDLRQRRKARGQKDLPWRKTWMEADPTGFKKTPAKDRAAATNRFRLAVTYWETKGSEKTAFSLSSESGVTR
jgi:hypothetical protein